MSNIYTHVTVTIGRNINDEPMNDELWDEFKHNAEIALYSAIDAVEQAELLELRKGIQHTGLYDGAIEQNYTVTALALCKPDYTPYQSSYDAASLWELREALAEQLQALCADYSQDSIAYSVAPSMLAERPPRGTGYLANR